MHYLALRVLTDTGKSLRMHVMDMDRMFRESPEAKARMPKIAIGPSLSLQQQLAVQGGIPAQVKGFGAFDIASAFGIGINQPVPQTGPTGSNSVLAPTGSGSKFSLGGALSSVADGLMQFASTPAFAELLRAGMALGEAEKQKDAAKAAQAAQEQNNAISMMMQMVQANNASGANNATLQALSQQLAQTQNYAQIAMSQAANRQPLSVPGPSPAAVQPTGTPSWVLPVVIGGVGLLAVGGMMFAMKKRN
jgi:type II secretory pathway pseudopilin PulG